MSEQWVEITLEVPLAKIDFSDCGDGCGQVDGLRYAKFGGARIESFSPRQVEIAERAMLEHLGEPVPVIAGAPSDRPRYTQFGRRKLKPADVEEFRQQDMAADLVTNVRRGG